MGSGAKREQLIEAVKAHARDHYAAGVGWDYIVECYSDAEIAEVLDAAGSTTPAQAIRAAGEEVGIVADYERDIKAAGGHVDGEAWEL